MTTDQNEWFRSLNAGLPDDVARLKAAGYYEEAVARIDALLAEDWTAVQNGPNTGANPAPAMPDAQREALLAQREILRRLPAEYIYTEQQAVEKMQAQVTGFTLEELRALERAGRVDWRFVEGEKHYFDRFDETLLATDPAFAARRRVPEPDSGASLARRKATHEKMLREGSASARITVEASVGMSDAAFARALARARAEGRHTVHVRAWLPLPAACESQSDLRLEHFSEPPAHVAAPDAPQRTAFWEANLAENRRFTARYSYTQTARYADPLGFASDPDQPSFDTGEEAPHIVFTPYLRALAAQLTQGVTSPAEKAQRFYDFVTLNVHYHYQPSYFVLEDIPTRCAMDRRGGLRHHGPDLHHPVPDRRHPRPVAKRPGGGPRQVRLPRLGHVLHRPQGLDVRRLLLWGVHGQGGGGGAPPPLLRQHRPGADGGQPRLSGALRPAHAGLPRRPLRQPDRRGGGRRRGPVGGPDRHHQRDPVLSGMLRRRYAACV